MGPQFPSPLLLSSLPRLCNFILKEKKSSDAKININNNNKNLNQQTR